MYTLYERDEAPQVPDGQLVDATGRAVRLADYWPNADLTAFVLTRHFG